ncbi:ComGF family competence protein [Planococcus salinarum]|uniref:ComGF family competence protein n=1 Tax=Planococcus salinarum TaxID=622695 RepID=UPI000E3D1A13|nr:ComGF family competence protein [Planococcus salinarum]TAA70668.1 hypothetical protein D2909_10535 [Planococcus salinarum]
MRRVKKGTAETSKEQGFVYYNALLDLLLLATLMPLIILFYLYSAEYMKSMESGQIEWRLFTADLQSYLAATDSVRIINEGTGLRIVRNGVEYDIEVYGTYIRKQKYNQGHEIMMTGISRCSFSVEGDVLHITALLSNGLEERAEYAITSP